jgi:hypothetical protein
MTNPALRTTKRGAVIRCYGVPLENLGPGCCRYPLGNMHDRPPYLYCGAAAGELSSWCPKHRARVFEQRQPARPIKTGFPNVVSPWGD